MITYVASSLFDSPAQVLVNTINTEGVMGKGIALQFRKIYPKMFSEYQSLCESGKIDIGKLWIYKSPHKWILNFPTKKSWRQPSKLEYLELGLDKFVTEFGELGVHSIAFPALGCGNGELDWINVRPLMERYLKKVPADVFIHPPLPRNLLAEHRTPEEIAEWLRSEPRAMGFSEVWLDLENLLRNKKSYATSASSFQARLTSGKENYLEILTESRSHRIDYYDLQEVWSRFRVHGYLRRGLVTNTMEKVLSYIMPIFAELPYVDRIKLSSTDMLASKQIVSGLKYTTPLQGLSKQPALFF